MQFPVVADISRGHLRLGLPFYAAVKIEAESGDGKILNFFAPENETTEQMKTLRTVIADGSGAEFKLRAAHVPSLIPPSGASFGYTCHKPGTNAT